MRRLLVAIKNSGGELAPAHPVHILAIFQGQNIGQVTNYHINIRVENQTWVLSAFSERDLAILNFARFVV
jgi:hypothetical protein